MQILPSKILAYLCLFLIKGLQTLNKNGKKKEKKYELLLLSGLRK